MTEKSEKLDYEKLLYFLKSAPANIFFKDTECRYRFLTQVCDDVHGKGQGHDILGLTDLEIHKDPQLGRFYYEDDLKIMATGKGSHYVSKYPTTKGIRYFDIKKNAVYDPQGKVIGVIGIIDDVTEQKELEIKLEELSFHDVLTGLYNRNYMEARGRHYLRQEDFPASIIMADCNYLKRTNDCLGHEYGDLLLKRVAETLKSTLPKSCIPIRFGGDEFLIIYPQSSAPMAEELISKMKQHLKERSDEVLTLDVAFGYYNAKDDSSSFDKIVHLADADMYKNKLKDHKNRKW